VKIPKIITISHNKALNASNSITKHFTNCIYILLIRKNIRSHSTNEAKLKKLKTKLKNLFSSYREKEKALIHGVEARVERDFIAERVGVLGFREIHGQDLFCWIWRWNILDLDLGWVVCCGLIDSSCLGWARLRLAQPNGSPKKKKKLYRGKILAKSLYFHEISIYSINFKNQQLTSK